MEKILLLKVSITFNVLIITIFLSCFYFFNETNGNDSYFNIGWSENFIFISIVINTPFKYFTLCSFIIVMNISEILMDNIAVPIIQFSTYNPYKSTIVDFTRNELELYSNLLFFIQISKRLLQVFVTLSQVDIAVISWISSQLSAYYAIRYLLDNKHFPTSRNNYVEVQPININYSTNI